MALLFLCIVLLAASVYSNFVAISGGDLFSNDLLYAFEGNNAFQWVRNVPQTGDVPGAESTFGRSAVVYNNLLYVFGGCATMIGPCTNNFYTMNPSSGNQWELLNPGGNVPSPRGFAAMAVNSGDAAIFIFGGFNLYVTSGVYRYDCNANSFTPFIYNGPYTPTAFASAVWSEQQSSFYVHGGISVLGKALSATYQLELHSSFTATWSLLTPGSERTSGHCAGFDKNMQTMFVYGGGDKEAVNSMRALDVIAGTWKTLTPTNPGPARRGAACVYDPDNTLFIAIGGSAETIVNQDVNTSDVTLQVLDYFSFNTLTHESTQGNSVYFGRKHLVAGVFGVLENTDAPTPYPTPFPTSAPQPSVAPTVEPGEPTGEPTADPTAAPVVESTEAPTPSPTWPQTPEVPTQEPTPEDGTPVFNFDGSSGTSLGTVATATSISLGVCAVFVFVWCYCKRRENKTQKDPVTLASHLNQNNHYDSIMEN